MFTQTPEPGHHTQRVIPLLRDGGDPRRVVARSGEDLTRRLGQAMVTGGVLTESESRDIDLRERVTVDDRGPARTSANAETDPLRPLADSPVGATGGIMLVGSSGGHLAQLLALEPWWASKGRHWVTFRTPDAESLLQREQVTWAHYPTTRNIPNLLRNAFLAVSTLRRHRPDAIVSTGAGVALPFFMVGRLLGVPTVYIEVFDRIDSRTLTARLCAPFTSTLLVQWEEQRLLYPHATVVGTLL